MRLGYNTNGFAHHDLQDALEILADLGYQSVALTLDYHALNPYKLNLGQEVAAVRRILEQRNLHCVIETGARFLLDPLHKHQPTLLSVDPTARQRRLDFLASAVVIGKELGAEAVSFWSGTPERHEPGEMLMDRLAEGCLRLCERAAALSMRLAFEPEPGMFIDSMPLFKQLHERVRHPLFGLTLDLGHLHCQGEGPIADLISEWHDCLWNIHIEDMRKGMHDHLMFGEGEIEFGPVFEALRGVDYEGGLHVELSRHSHDAVNTARRAFRFLRSYCPI